MRIPVYIEFSSQFEDCVGYVDFNEVGPKTAILRAMLKKPRFALRPGGEVTRSHRESDGTFVVDEFELTHIGLCFDPDPDVSLRVPNYHVTTSEEDEF